jgi:hypothetical protein
MIVGAGVLVDARLCGARDVIARGPRVASY